jgi:hypothetical protein
MRHIMSKVLFAFAIPLLLGALASAQQPETALPASLNPQIRAIVDQVSAARIAEIQKKLGSFGTRNIYSPTDRPDYGIGAARQWIAAQFRSYSPRLQVSFDKHRVAQQNARMIGNVEIWNVVAVLPGTDQAARHVIVSGHYDSINMVFKNGPDGRRVLDPVATVNAPAPGVTDDGSGTAAVMELARVMSQYTFRKTLVFIAFAAEEYGLFGSGFYAQEAAARHDRIDGVFNNDIIGSDVTGDGETGNRYVNVYSQGPEDSSSRELARYMKLVAERYQPGFRVHLVFRHDRFGRGGDHSPFNAFGYPAIRVTTPMENFSHQHTATDTFENTDPAYTVLVARANAAAMAELALAPRTPEIPLPSAARGRAFASPLSRGTMPAGFAGYDAVLRWETGPADPARLGYEILIRPTTAPDWEGRIFVGDVSTYTLHNVNIDEVVLGVKAIGKDGSESPAVAYVAPPYRQPNLDTY